MRKIYRIFVMGAVPADIKDRTAALHAAAILKSEAKDAPTLPTATANSTQANPVEIHPSCLVNKDRGI